MCNNEFCIIEMKAILYISKNPFYNIIRMISLEVDLFSFNQFLYGRNQFLYGHSVEALKAIANNYNLNFEVKDKESLHICCVMNFLTFLLSSDNSAFF